MMNCRDARRVLEQRDHAPEAQRDLALAHLDRCPECAALGPSLDPLVLFRRLPTVEVSSADALRMREAVAVLRRAPAEPAPARSGGWLRLAAAIVAAGGLWLLPGPGPKASGTAPVAASQAVPQFLPSVETLGGSGAYVAAQVTEDDLTLVILANVDVAGR